MAKSTIVIGGGVAGLATAAALGSAGHRVTVLEARPFLGGRATSYPGPGGETIDNCQHILLRCCVNLMDFYRRLGVLGEVEFHRTFYFIEPGGRRSTLGAGLLPAPAHFTESFLKMSCLSLADKLTLGRGVLALRREYRNRQDLDRITMLDWLREKNQTPRAIDRFWRQILVSAINVELDQMAAIHGFQVFWLGFLKRRDCYEMGVPRVPLGALYTSAAWKAWPVEIELRQPVSGIEVAGGRASGVRLADGTIRQADYYVSAVPFDRVKGLLPPEAGVDASAFSHSPITGVHLWFDRPVTDLPHATLLDRTIHWMYNKEGGRHVTLVVSASNGLNAMARGDVIALAVRELAEFFPAVKEATLLKSHVVKELRATFLARPGLGSERPPAATRLPNLFLAGDWTRSGWPSTMEGAARSGHIAADAVLEAAGLEPRFLLPDVA